MSDQNSINAFDGGIHSHAEANAYLAKRIAFRSDIRKEMTRVLAPCGTRTLACGGFPLGITGLCQYSVARK